MSEKPTDIKEIEDRISVLKKKQTKSDGKENYSQGALAFQIAIELVSGVLIGAGIGYILDELFDFKFICLLIFIIFGGIAGLLNTKRYLKDDKKRKEGK